MTVHRLGISLAMSALALILGACGSDATTPTSEVTATTIGPTSTIPSTTTLGPDEVVTTFVGAITSADFRSGADLAIEVRIGEIVVAGTGQMLFDGGNSYTSLELGGDLTETFDINGVSYTRLNSGPWVSDEAVATSFEGAPSQSAIPGADLELAAWMQTVAALTYQGEVVEGGLVLHRLEPPGGTMDPVGLGYPGGGDVTVEATFWARDDGQPHAIDLTVDDRSDPEFAYTLSLRLDFMPPDPEAIVEAPSDYLYRHSSDLGYTIGYPRNWDVIEDRSEFPADFFIGIQGDELDIYRTDLEPPSAESLNVWLDGFRIELGQALGAEFGDAGETTLEGQSARFLPFEYEDTELGSICGVYLVAQPAEEVVIEFVYHCGSSDDTATALEKLLDLVSTFSWEE